MSKNKILVIDDDVTIREMLELMLEDKYDVRLAAGGVEGLDMIQKDKPDLVLLDVMMPDRTGFEVLAEIRKTWSPVFLPVIMVTANDELDDITLALNSGADDYLIKPIDFTLAFKRIEKLVLITNLYNELFKARNNVETKE